MYMGYLSDILSVEPILNILHIPSISLLGLFVQILIMGVSDRILLLNLDIGTGLDAGLDLLISIILSINS